MLAATLSVDLFLATARWGPLVFLSCGMKESTLLGLARVIGAKHAWSLSLLGRGHVGDVCASALPGVVRSAAQIGPTEFVTQ